MKAIFRVNAAPGFEDAVEAALGETEGIFAIVQEKDGNFDFVIAMEAEDANGIRDIESAIRHESGVQGLEPVRSPDQDLLDRLRPS